MLDDYKCNECGFTDEYSTSIPSMMLPKDGICPECNKGVLERVYNFNGISFDLVGAGAFINDYGKHAWKKNLSAQDQAKVLTGEKDPY